MIGPLEKPANDSQLIRLVEMLKNLFSVHRSHGRELIQKLNYYFYAIRSRVLLFIVPRLPKRKRQNFIVIDPSLRASNGHHAEFAKLIKAELKPRFNIIIYSNFFAVTSILGKFSARPVFFDDISYEGGDFPRVYRNALQTLTAGLNKINTRELAPDTIGVAHTASIFQLGALADWYCALPPSRRFRLLIQFHYPLEFHVKPRSAVPAAIEAARDAVANLVAAGPVRIASTMTALSDQIASQLEENCTTLPIPVRWPDLSDKPKPDSQIVFGFFGGLRTAKGAILLGEALPVFAKRHPDARLIVHAPRTSDSATVRILEKLPNIELIQNSFPDKRDYYCHFCRPWCILLPYDPSEYIGRSSGVILEALGLGKAVVVSKSATMMDTIDRWKGHAFLMPDYTAEGLLSAMETALEAYHANPSAGAPNMSLMSEYSQENFCAKLLNLTSE